MAKIDVYEIVTNKIIEQLEKGVVPWKKGWTSVGGELPSNLVTKKEYKGINVFLLWSLGYSDPRFLTYKQAAALGGNVKQGAKGMPIIFWTWIDGEDKNGKEKKVPLLRYYTVFNIEQCEGLERFARPVVEGKTFNAIAAADKVVNGMPMAPTINHGATGASYNPASDTVRMPNKEDFHSPEEYYATLFHELAHSTGHASRLNRPGVTDSDGFGKEKYSKEELIAEFSAAFLCAQTGIESLVENNAAYISSWLKALKNDKRLLITAASAGQKAADFILGDAKEEEEAEAA